MQRQRLEVPVPAAEVEQRQLRSIGETAGLVSLVAGKCFGAVAALSLEVERFAVWAVLVLSVESVSWVSAVVVAAAQSTEASSAGGWLH